MRKINILKNIGILFLVLLIYLLVVTIFNYFEIISPKVINIMSFIFIILLFFCSGFYLAYKSESKGYLSGLVMGGINIVLFFVIALLLGCNIKLNILLYFLILLLASCMGGMFGINFNNKKLEKNKY